VALAVLVGVSRKVGEEKKKEEELAVAA